MNVRTRFPFTFPSHRLGFFFRRSFFIMFVDAFVECFFHLILPAKRTTGQIIMYLCNHSDSFVLTNIKSVLDVSYGVYNGLWMLRYNWHHIFGCAGLCRLPSTRSHILRCWNVSIIFKHTKRETFRGSSSCRSTFWGFCIFFISLWAWACRTRCMIISIIRLAVVYSNELGRVFREHWNDPFDNCNYRQREHLRTVSCFSDKTTRHTRTVNHAI